MSLLLLWLLLLLLLLLLSKWMRGILRKPTLDRRITPQPEPLIRIGCVSGCTDRRRLRRRSRVEPLLRFLDVLRLRRDCSTSTLNWPTRPWPHQIIPIRWGWIVCDWL